MINDSEGSHLVQFYICVGPLANKFFLQCFLILYFRPFFSTSSPVPEVKIKLQDSSNLGSVIDNKTEFNDYIFLKGHIVGKCPFNTVVEFYIYEYN
jgi:hypothetical protein